jgi:hypothetical protein
MILGWTFDEAIDIKGSESVESDGQENPAGQPTTVQVQTQQKQGQK